MTISDPDSTAANAAITALNAALTTYGTKADPTSKDLYAGSTILPLITSNSGLAVTLGRTLYTEQLAAATAAVAPFVANTEEQERITHELFVPKQLLGWVNALASGISPAASEAPNYARLIVSILTRCLASAS